MKIKNRFYVASRNTVLGIDARNWAKETLEEAIEHAREICEESDKEQYVVQVVKVIKPQRKPVLVEDVE